MPPNKQLVSFLLLLLLVSLFNFSLFTAGAATQSSMVNLPISSSLTLSTTPFLHNHYKNRHSLVITLEEQVNALIQNEKIIHLPASIFQFATDGNFWQTYGNLVIVIIVLSVFILFLVCLVLPMILSCGALWIFKCCLHSANLGPREESELIDQQYSRLAQVTLDPGWKTRVRYRLFDVNFTDCAILIFWLLFWPFRKLSCGIFDSCFILRMTRFNVRRMRVGNRRLDLHISDACCTIPFIHFLNNFCNFYTFGLWRALGLYHRFYLSRIDERIYWKPIENDGRYESQVVWQNFSEKNSFRWFSIYCGLYTELLYWFLKVINVFALFLLGPFIEAWYIRKRVQYSKFGGVGSFAVYSNGSLQALVVNSPKVLTLSNSISGCSYFTRILIYRLLNLITLGIFGCVVGGDRYFLGFIDDHLYLSM